MAKNTKRTSKPIASQASKTLRNPKASKLAKSLAGSALAQSNTSKQTGAKMEAKAAKTAKSKNAPIATRRLAGSVMSQSNKAR
jgi:hypothetical protein